MDGAGVAPGGYIRVRAVLVLLAAIALLTMSPAAWALDPEGCLTCHRYKGLARLDKLDNSIHQYYVDPDYYDHALGPHSRLRCTECHNRSEVEVVPHRAVSPVDCTRACHVIGAQGLEIAFSHDSIAAMLEESVHKQQTLAEANQLLGSPIRPGQSQCLLCHNEPHFRRGAHSWIEQSAPVQRCNVCHDETFPVDTPYFYWHVYARSRSAQTHEETVRTCAVCHHNEAIQKRFEHPDTIASYLSSFHGKAMLLGSEETAVCLDCHVGRMQNVHLMKASEDPTSSTNVAHLSDTCRSPACHPLAGAEVSRAAVHLDLSSGGGVEYIVALIFIAMIVFTFGPSLMLSALEMLHIGIGREDPNMHARAVVAEQLLETRRGRRLLSRFNFHQRFQHWCLVVAFATLVYTGFPLKFADRAWAAWMVQVIGGVDVARGVHRVAGMLLILGLLYHLVYVGVLVIRKARQEKTGVLRAIFRMPLAVTPYDMREMTHLVMYLLGLRKNRPLQGRFSMPEKFEYFGVFWGTVLLGATGLLMWYSDWTTRHMSGRVLTLAYLVHGFEAFLALLHVGVVHMVSVIFSPAVAPVSPAMFTGLSGPEELAEAHPAWVDEAKRKYDAGEGKEVDHE